MPSRLQVLASPSAAARREFATAALRGAGAGAGVLVVGASRAAADELVFAAALEAGGVFGMTRTGFTELAARLALPVLARRGLAPSTALGESALATRVAFDARSRNLLAYFAPVAGTPGFPVALARTLRELRQAQVASADVDGERSAADLAVLLERAAAAREEAGTADFADILTTAARVLEDDPSALASTFVVLLDVSLSTAAECRFASALLGASQAVSATVPAGDRATRRFFEAAGARHQPPPRQPIRALDRLQEHLFADSTPPPGSMDDSVAIFSAPGENREAVEIARRALDEAARGVPFDEMAILLRAPRTYTGLIEHALARAGVPAWFHRGTRRPDASGRALLALLACADEHLSARRFAEYVSLAQVPMENDTALDTDSWTPPVDDVASAVVAADLQQDDVLPEHEASAAAARGASPYVIAGTVRAPWRWEELIVEAAVIEGFDRWERRLAGLAEEYTRRLREAASDDPESPRARAVRRDAEQLEALRAFALPVLRELAEWPAAQSWDQWLAALSSLAPRVLRDPSRVRRVLQEMAPLTGVGPVTLHEVRDVLTPRLSTLTHEPPRRRHGRVFVGTPEAARGRAFRVVFVPGLAERVFPQRIREDALLLDDLRRGISDALPTRDDRVGDERLQLSLAVGAASERLYVSFPRMELQESRPRVPSFYVLDVIRAIEGAVPSGTAVTRRAFVEGQATLAWPAPPRPEVAIDDFEHDLATLRGLLQAPDPSAVKGRARYLYELSPALQRSLTSRWLRWHRRTWETADGLIRALPSTTGPVLQGQRLGARAYSLSALQRFASCPYQFLLAAIYRLAPMTVPAPLQRLDPLTRGDLFHRMQAATLRRLRDARLLPLSADALPQAQQTLEAAVEDVEREAYDALAPAIDRVWRDEIGGMTRDLKIWLEKLVDEGQEWVPELFEFAFGLEQTEGRDAASVREAARIGGRFSLRGSIDLVERHRTTRLLRVTDHKTGRNRTERGTTIVQGGRVLQPVIYGLALEALWPHERVYSGRLSFCTTAGGFTEHEIPLLDAARRHGVEVLEIIDRAIEQGVLAAKPARDACTICDFVVICGPGEELRTRRKAGALMADLESLRTLP